MTAKEQWIIKAKTAIISDEEYVPIADGFYFPEAGIEIRGGDGVYEDDSFVGLTPEEFNDIEKLLY